MNHSSLKLAAIASAAVRGLKPAFSQFMSNKGSDFEIAYIVDEANVSWIVRLAKSEEASANLETEIQILQIFTPAIRKNLPFVIPEVSGHIMWKQNHCALVNKYLEGSPLSVETLNKQSKILPEIGRSIAAIHNLDANIVEQSGFATYSAEEIRLRKFNELDQIAGTSKVSSRLLSRWEKALEDLSLWRFQPKTIHGDLYEGNILVKNGKVVAVTSWADTHVGDPADDFMWLTSVGDVALLEAVMDVYKASCVTPADKQFLIRAQLGAELSVAKWLMQGLVLNSAHIVGDATAMLDVLDEEVEKNLQPPLAVPPPTVADDVAAVVSEGNQFIVKKDQQPNIVQMGMVDTFDIGEDSKIKLVELVEEDNN